MGKMLLFGILIVVLLTVIQKLTSGGLEWKR